MRRQLGHVIIRMVLALLLLTTLIVASSQCAPQTPGRGRGPDREFATDRDTFQWLLRHHQSLRRSVSMVDAGVETLTESDDPTVVAKLQDHVAAMVRRIEQGQPIRRRDPLFAELFRHHNQIKMKVENTEKGVRVMETSADPDVVRLIRAHAKIVSGFVEFGFGEARKNHAVPSLKKHANSSIAVEDAQDDSTVD